MAELRVLFLLVLSVVCIECAVLSIKELYCRDPVTGKLHAVNTTWASTSFCGNYTCKMRIKNINQTNVVPIREFNITNMIPINDQKAYGTDTVVTKNKIIPNLMKVIRKNEVTEDVVLKDVNKFHPKFNNLKYLFNPFEENQIYKPSKFNSRSDGDISKSNEERDRYLTDEEINDIAEILHTVKKSDLDALVDIYDLAQDIYAEIHKVTDEELTEAAMNIIKDEEKLKKYNHKSISYWYDPLQNKEKAADIDLDLQETMPKADRYDLDLQETMKRANRYDLGLQDTRITQSTMHASKPASKQQSTEKPIEKLRPLNVNLLPTYFNGALIRTDFGKLPYNFPLSKFHRMSTNTHQPPRSTSAPRRDSIVVKNIPCNTKQKSIWTPGTVTEKVIQPSLLLPYPFANIRHYNVSDYPKKNYYGISPWSLNYYDQYKYYRPYFKAQMPAVPKAILVNPHLSEVQDVEQEQVRTKNGNLLDKWFAKSSKADLKTGSLLQDWQTEPLSDENLNEIRAHIDPSKLIKAFPFRKKVYLEKVATVKRRDMSIVNRSKRSPDKETKEVDNYVFSYYEPYLENITCAAEIKLGYFRIGNMSYPYPDCCPELIEPR